ncbi:MAG: hydroxymethylglutaryl-CoA lyase [Ktedonobacterales bacterium]
MAENEVRRGVTIIDVFARDGLQTVLHEPGLRVPTTDEKVAIIEQLDAAGVPEIEITGFVHPRVIPSLADAEDVARAVLSRPHRAIYRALGPNLRGAERAMAAGVPKLSCLIVASETYSRLNSNMTVERNVQEIERIAAVGRAAGFEVSVGMGTSFLCPYDGVLAEDYILGLIERFVAAGITEVSLADSVGLAWPTLVRDRVRAILARWPELTIGLHLHTLAGTAIANVFAAYEAGVTHFEGAVGGIGGGIAMPVHTTNMGNVATEDLLYLFESCGVPTGIDPVAIARIGREAQALIGTGNGFTTSFGTMEAFLETSNRELARLRSAPPGSSRSQSA